MELLAMELYRENAARGNARAPEQGKSSNRPFIMFPSDVASDSSLSPEARLLYALLLDFARGKDGCYPTERTLAKLIGGRKKDGKPGPAHVRSVQRWLAELEVRGLIRRHPWGRRNYYTIEPAVEPEPTDPVPEQATPVSPVYKQQATSKSPQQATPVSPQEDKREEDNSSAAAAGNSSQENPEVESATCAPASKTAEATLALAKLGMPQMLAQRYAEADADLALAATPWLGVRLADAADPIRNPVGFMRYILINPAEAGFSRDAGVWQPPREFAKAQADAIAARRANEERQRQKAAAWEQTCREREAAKQRNQFAAFARTRVESERSRA
jgi:hypothetical protein